MSLHLKQNMTASGIYKQIMFEFSSLEVSSSFAITYWTQSHFVWMCV